ncbi:MAG: linear amide C-N hydrolase [Pseudomonadota bacterium]
MPRLLLLLLLALLPAAADACTTIAFTDRTRPILAYNFDFPIGQAVVLINKRGLAKVSETEGQPARWRARYASITFNMFGRESPMSGMNEAGLATSQMWLDEARYEAPDERPGIGVAEWMQYVLDTSATVDEALAAAARVRIDSRIPLHYKLMDAQGNAAVVEFLDGKAEIRRGDGLPVAALANDSYQRSLDFMREVTSGTAQATGSGSLARFIRAALAQQSRRDPADDPVAKAFATLADVAQSGRTQWSIVYDLATRTVHWHTRGNAAIRSLALDGVAASCATPPLFVDIDEGKGDVGRLLRPFGSADNERLILATFKATPFLAHIDEAVLRQSARWPDSALCEAPGGR